MAPSLQPHAAAGMSWAETDGAVYGRGIGIAVEQGRRVRSASSATGGWHGRHQTVEARKNGPAAHGPHGTFPLISDLKLRAHSRQRRCCPGSRQPPGRRMGALSSGDGGGFREGSTPMWQGHPLVAFLCGQPREPPLGQKDRFQLRSPRRRSSRTLRRRRCERRCHLQMYCQTGAELKGWDPCDSKFCSWRSKFRNP